MVQELMRYHLETTEPECYKKKILKTWDLKYFHKIKLYMNGKKYEKLMATACGKRIQK